MARDYKYISTTKAEMLGSDIKPSVWQRLEPSVGVNAFWLKLGVTLRQQPASRTDILQAITEKLAEEGKLGQFDEAILPAYVQGTMEMRYGSWEGDRLELVWFVGSDETHLVALGGRLRHMTSVYEDELRKPGEGSMPFGEKHNAAALASHLKPEAGDEPIEGRGSPWTYDLEVIDGSFYGELRGTFEFVAEVEGCDDIQKPVVPGHKPAPSRRYLIGSPVWVAKVF
jgi:Family of unknown function (DUF7019)